VRLSPAFWSLLVGTDEEVAERFAAMAPSDRMRVLTEYPGVYWRALDLYVGRLAARLQDLAARCRADRAAARDGALPDAVTGSGRGSPGCPG
jgi:hypothetical protein